MTPYFNDKSEMALRAAAAAWTVRRDRGLSAAESIEFELWLAADERHAAAMQRAAGSWALLDGISEEVARRMLRQSIRRLAFWRVAVFTGGLAAAACGALVFFGWSQPNGQSNENSAAIGNPNAPSAVTLSDGTWVQLNRYAAIAERFTAAERRVALVRGEAHFSVTKNPARPFIVEAGGVEVRAVGTAFNVQLQSAAVDVLVTEGVVQLKSAAAGTVEAFPRLESGHRAVVALAPTPANPAVVVTTVDADDIARTLAWREPLLRLGGATLAEVAVAFERRTGRRVVLADAALAELRLGGRFRADDVEGFAHLLAATTDIEVEHAANGDLVLRKKNSISR